MSHRATQTRHSTLVHLQMNGSQSYCGVISFCYAPAVVNRYNMCLNCFGKDHGASQWTAEKLGLEKIVEYSDTTISRRQKVSASSRKMKVTLGRFSHNISKVIAEE